MRAGRCGRFKQDGCNPVALGAKLFNCFFWHSSDSAFTSPATVPPMCATDRASLLISFFLLKDSRRGAVIYLNTTKCLASYLRIFGKIHIWFITSTATVVLCHYRCNIIVFFNNFIRQFVYSNTFIIIFVFN